MFHAVIEPGRMEYSSDGVTLRMAEPSKAPVTLKLDPRTGNVILEGLTPGCNYTLGVTTNLINQEVKKLQRKSRDPRQNYLNLRKGKW